MIPNSLLKETAVEIALFLVLLFQASLDQRVLPKEWKHVYVPPVYKKGDCSLLVNYHPVSLTCTCCKVLEHIVYSLVIFIKHLESNGILSEAPYDLKNIILALLNWWTLCMNLLMHLTRVNSSML